MSSDQAWRCPLCGASAERGPDHLREAHGLGRPAEDRFGLRRGLRPDAAPEALRPRRRRPRGSLDERDLPPARPAPLPPDAAVLRLLCEGLEDRELASLQARLAELSGVEAATIDVYGGTIDLFIDRNRATPAHLVAMATERFRLPVRGAEIHRRPSPGAALGEDTRLLALF